MKKLLLLSVLFIAVACKTSEKNPVTTTPTVELFAFEGGSIGANNLNLFAQGDTYKGDSLVLADAFYVIKHAKGALIWDTGLPEGLVGQAPYTTPDGAFTISRKDSLASQLSKVGLSTKDINYIAFSHIHFDHTGAANQFADATWLVQKEEYEFATGEAIKGNGFYAPDSFSALKKTQILEGDYDVFGDGTVIIKSFPGHTPGHQALYLELGLEHPVLLTGDLYHFEQNRTDAIVPQFNYDIPQTEESIKKFEAFAKEKNASVIIQHSIADFKKLQDLLKK